VVKEFEKTKPILKWAKWRKVLFERKLWRNKGPLGGKKQSQSPAFARKY
jgi:hypothetical protein